MNNYIMHHGVRGMKWGIRKERTSSAAAGKSKKRRKQMSPRTKNAIKLGVQIGATIAGKYLIQRYIDSASTTAAISTGRTAAEKVWASGDYSNLTMNEMRKLDLAF